MANLGKLEWTLTADSTRFNRAMGRAGASLKRLAGLAATVAGVGGLGAIISSSARNADQLQKLAIRLGTTTEVLSGLKGVAERSGLSFQEMATSLQRLQRRSSEAAHGTGVAVEAFKELGLGAAEFAKLPLDEKLFTLAKAFEGVKDPADRLRLIVQLMDTEGAGMLQTFEGGADALRKLFEGQQRLATTTTEEGNRLAALNDRWADFKRVTGETFETITVGLSGPLGKLLEWMTTGINRLNQFVDSFGGWGEAFDSLASKLSGLLDRGALAGQAVKRQYQAFGNLLTGDFSGAGQAFRDAGALAGQAVTGANVLGGFGGKEESAPLIQQTNRLLMDVRDGVRNISHVAVAG